MLASLGYQIMKHCEREPVCGLVRGNCGLTGIAIWNLRTPLVAYQEYSLSVALQPGSALCIATAFTFTHHCVQPRDCSRLYMDGYMRARIGYECAAGQYDKELTRKSYAKLAAL